MHILFCLIVPLLTMLLLLRRWQHPWQLRQPLFTLRRAAISADLLVEPRRVTAAHLPFEPAAQPRLQSGALLWASAATVTHSIAAEQDRAAILAAVKPLGFTPEKFLAHCPILEEVQQNGLRGYVVRDGQGQRAYFIGDPAALLAECTLVWAQQERDKIQSDATRIPTGEGLYGLAMAPVVNGCIGSLTYLGSLQIAAPAMDPAVAEALLPDGWTLQVVSPGQQPWSVLHIATQPEGPNGFRADIAHWKEQLQSGFARSHREGLLLICLFIAQLMLGIAALIWSAPAWLVPAAGLLLLPGALEEHELHLTRRSVPALVWLLVWPVITDSFMQYAVPGSSATLLALIASAACMGATASSWKLVLPASLACTVLLWLICQPAPLPASFCLIAGALHGLIARLLRPVECS